MSVEVLSVRGLRPECGKVDRDLWLWFLEAKKDYKNYHGPRVTKRMVQNKAIQAFKDAGITGFKASDGWYVRWMKRWLRFGSDSVDANPREAVEQVVNNISLLKKKPFKRNSKKAGKQIILSIPRHVGSSDCVSLQEQELFMSSSSSYPIDKLRILHDVASREFADSILQEMSSVETRNGLFEDSAQPLNDIPHAGQSDTTSLLDFDQISWNDVPYVDKSEYSGNSGALYRIDENNLNYSSSVMSQMMEFAEICHLKEKELQQQHKGLGEQAQSESPLEVEDQRLCHGMSIIQQQNSLLNSEAKTFSVIPPCSSSTKQPYSCSENEYLPDNPFYSMDDSNFHILDNNDSEFAQHHTGYQTDKAGHNIQKEGVNMLLSTPYSNELNIGKANSHLAQEKESIGSIDCADKFNEKFQSSDVNILKVNSCQAPSLNGKNLDVLMNGNSNPDNSNDIALSVVNDEEPTSICCAEQSSIGVWFGSNQEAGQLHINEYDDLTFSRRTELCAVSKTNVDAMFDESHQSNQMDIVKLHGLNISLPVNNLNNGIEGHSELNGLEVQEKRGPHCPTDTSPNIAQDDNYQLSQMDVVELNHMDLSCSNIASRKRNNLGVLCNNGYLENEVNVIELSNFDETNADVLCSTSGEHVAFNGDFNPSPLNIVELDSVGQTGNLSDEVALHTDFQTDQISIIELNGLSMEGEEANYSDDPSAFLASPSQGLLPTQSALCTNSESSLLLFTESPFIFNDDEMSDMLPIPPPDFTHPSPSNENSAAVVPSTEKLKTAQLTPSGGFMSSLSSSDIMAISKDGTESDLDLVDSVILDQVVGMEDQQNQRLNINVHSSDKTTSTEEDTSNKNISHENDKKTRRLGGERYLPCFKRKVLEYAAQHTAKDAAKQFHVHADTVTLWSRNMDAKTLTSPVLPDQLMLTWLKLKRESGSLLTRNQVSSKAKELLQTPGSWQKNKSRWLHVWGSRFVDQEKAAARIITSSKTEESPSFVPSSFSKALYPDEFKIEVALFAEKTSQNLASSVFNIARKRVFEWVAALKGSKKSQEEITQKTAKHSVSDSRERCSIKKSQLLGDSSSRKELSTSEISRSKLKGKGLGRSLTSVAVDRELWEWFCEQTAIKNKPKSREIRAKAMELFRAHNYEHIRCSHGWFKKWSIRYGIALRYEGDSDLLVWCLEQFDHNRNISHRDLLKQAYLVLSGTHKSEFKASAGWALRFCKRHRTLLSSRPSFEVDLPEELEDRVTEFRSVTQQLMTSLTTSLKSIGSMDEIPLNFTAGGSGSSRSRLLLRRSGFENCHATVVLSCLSDGTLLPPAVIFKGSGQPEWISVEEMNVLVLHHEDSCMNASAMLHWLQLVWFKNVTSPSILVLDCFEPHTAESIKEASSAEKCHLAIIPAGCSSKLQPLDISVTRQFEAIIADRWAKHYASLDHFSTVKRSSYSSNSDVIRWVAEALSKLQESKQDSIQNSFVTMGLTSRLAHSDKRVSLTFSSVSSEL